MIPARYVKAYLNEPKDDFRWMKQLKRDDLLDLINDLRPRPKLWPDMRQHQLVAFYLGVAYGFDDADRTGGGFSYWLDMGSGKSLIALELMKYWRQCGHMRRGLVFTLSDKAYPTWERQIDKFEIGIPFTSLEGSSAEKWATLDKFKDGIVLCSYPGAVHMVSDKQRGKMQLQQDLIDKLSADVDVLILDECFPSDTQITTSAGPKRIDSLIPGELVLTSSGFRPIKSVMKKQSEIIVDLKLSDGGLISCTPNHPFFTDLGWVCAGNLKGRYLYDEASVRTLQQRVFTPKAIQEAQVSGVPLFVDVQSAEEMQEAILQSTLRSESERVSHNWEALLEQGQATVCQASQAYQPDLQETRTWLERKNPWGQWQANPEGTASSSWRIRLAVETGAYHLIGPQAAWLSNLLQGRLSPTKKEVGYRSGRAKSFQPKIIRSKERRSVAPIRVESVSYRKLDSPINVYTLEIEGCPHFYAEGFLVHNSTRAGHAKSLTHQLCDYIAEYTRNRYALAGLPFGRDPTMLFHQQKIIDGGASFGATLGMFHEAYFTKEHNIWAKSRFAFNYTFDKSKTEQFSRRMQHRSITYEEHECTDVPKVVEIRVPVRLRGEARQYYERVHEEIVELAKSGNADLQATKNVFLRMRQITSGFLGFKSDETGERAQVVFTQNAKLDALLEELGGVPEGRKAVVFYEYTWSGRRISEELKKGGIGHAWLWSGTKDYRKELDRFMKNKSCLVMVLQSKLGAFSLDGLQEVANYLFYYESPVPVIDRRQSEKRIKRPGQKRRVYQYDLICQGTVDEKILEFHREGADLMRSVRKDPRILL